MELICVNQYFAHFTYLLYKINLKINTCCKLVFYVYLGHLFLFHVLQSSICSKSCFLNPRSLHLFNWLASDNVGESAHMVTLFFIPRPQNEEQSDQVDHFITNEKNVNMISNNNPKSISKIYQSGTICIICLDIYLVMARYISTIKISNVMPFTDFGPISLKIISVVASVLIMVFRYRDLDIVNVRYILIYRIVLPEGWDWCKIVFGSSFRHHMWRCME